MKKALSLSVLLSLFALGQMRQPPDVQASTLPISESSYVRITNYSGWYLYTNYEDPSGPPVLHEWKGFSAAYAPYYKSIPTIETKLFNFKYPGSPPTSGWYGCEQNGLLFDCHSGYANVGDYASAMPLALCGMEPWMHVEFDWASNVSFIEARYLWLQIAGYGYPPDYTSYPEQRVHWCMRLRAGTRKGHAIIDLPSSSISDAVYIRLAVEPVPEPGSFITLGVGLSMHVLRKRRNLR